MSLFLSFLNSAVYKYYPKNLYNSDPLYYESREAKAFMLLRNEYQNKTFLNQLTEFKEILKTVYPDKWININKTEIITPCYQIEIVQEKNHSIERTTTIYLSMLVPFYHMINLNVDYDFQRKHKEKHGSFHKQYYSTSFNIDKELKNFISTKVLEHFYYNEFPRELLNLKIPDVFALNSTEIINYRKAFFTDSYKMSHAQYHIDKI
ncbi:hypothetical protein [Aquimarina sp. SS2-1]|uniref:hypothetical protein n=1 Tax=Aquimarina besae TaxID=3342247 RepID=UPI00367098C7